MVYISKVYTRSGDAGTTRLSDGTETSKDSLRVRAYGETDELNAIVGMVRVELRREAAEAEDLKARVDAFLGSVQQRLFDLGAELSLPAAVDGDASLRVEQEDIDALEQEIDALNDDLEPLKSFILPGGGPASTATHLARTVCRRVERTVVTLAAAEAIRPEAVKYLNRASDYFFVLSRALSAQLGHDEVLWEQRRR